MLQILESSDDQALLTNIAGDLNELLLHISEMYGLWSAYLNNIDTQNPDYHYRAAIEPSGGERGRPRFRISRDQLVYLRSLSFTWTKIASILNVSRMTVYRRREYDMLVEPSRSMTEGDLHHFVEQLRTHLPDVGESLVIGRLRPQGYMYIISREHVRQSIRSSDPLNTALRWHGVAVRRPNSVPGPNSLWHIGEYAFPHCDFIIKLLCNCALCLKLISQDSYGQVQVLH